MQHYLLTTRMLIDSKELIMLQLLIKLIYKRCLSNAYYVHQVVIYFNAYYIQYNVVSVQKKYIQKQ